MEAKYMAEHNHYFTAFFSIENGKLFAGFGDQEGYDSVFPVVKGAEYPFISVVKHQSFVDEILNNMIVNSKDRNKKFSIVLNGKDSCISSNGTIIFAAAKTAAALHYATKQIYENIEQFKKPHFTGYHEELAIVPKGFVRF